MTRRSKIWLAAAVLFSLVNLAGGVFAAAQREPLHATVHVALLLLGAYAAVWLASPDSVRGLWRRKGSENPALPDNLGDRLTNLEQSVDAVAIEVERIGEGQRFLTRLFTDNDAARAQEEGAAEPADRNAREAAPRERLE